MTLLPYDDFDLDQLAAFIAACANANRLVIFGALANHEKPVKMLAEEVGISQSALSQHLAILRSRNLIERRRAAQQVFYSLRQDIGRELSAQLCELLSPQGRKASLKLQARRIHKQGH